MVLTTYGRSSGFCIDPIEKKPLNHFLPGSSVLSFGTAGCNLGCQFCQNWSISKSREVERLSETATPETIARAAQQLGCRSVAFTYNDPVIWAEYAMDVARACRAIGVKTVAVTAGYITPVARGPFFAEMDAANVDLKAFTEQFYQRLTLSHLAPVLETLRWLHAETDVWLEVTNLLIPRANDTPDELRRLCDWVLEALGDEVPLHFTAFHPDFRLRDRERTPYDLARRTGLKYVYVGNVNDLAHQSTYCPRCRQVVIERDWYQLGRYSLSGDRCQHCGGGVAGRFDQVPGSWGRRRLPVRMAQFAPSLSTAPAATRTLMTLPARVAAGVVPGDVSADDTGRALSAEQERAIHRAASAVVAAAVRRQPVRLADPALSGAGTQPIMGAFVSLKRRGRLRGCCGIFGERTSIADALSRAASRTATEDVRLPPVSATELRYLDLEVWLLDAPQPVLAPGEDRRSAITIERPAVAGRRGRGRARRRGFSRTGVLEGEPAADGVEGARRPARHIRGPRDLRAVRSRDCRHRDVARARDPRGPRSSG